MARICPFLWFCIDFLYFCVLKYIYETLFRILERQKEETHCESSHL